MKIFLNIMLGILSTLCAAALVLQSFLFPPLPGWADVLLRIGTGLFLQILMLRLTKKKLLRYLPLLIFGAVSIWGFFLLLTSPSWIHATLGGLMGDYVSFFGGCLLACILNLLRPQMKKLIKLLRRNRKRRKKQKQMKNIPHS